MTLRSYPVENVRQKGCYVARLDDLDDTYGVGREFLRGLKHGGEWHYQPADIGTLPAWLVRTGRVCDGCGRADPETVELIAADDIAWQVVAVGVSTRDLIAVVESGPPGANPQQQVTEALQEDRVPVYAGDNPEPF